MARSRLRTFPASVVERVVEHFGYLPAYLVRKVIERVGFELRREELRENPWVVKLAALEPGATMFYRPGVTYLQTADKERARALLDNPQARWSSRYHEGMLVVKRLA